MLTTVLVFLAPVFYPASALPEGIFAPGSNLNPLTFIIEQARAVTIWGHAPDFAGLALYTRSRSWSAGAASGGSSARVRDSPMSSDDSPSASGASASATDLR